MTALVFGALPMGSVMNISSVAMPWDGGGTYAIGDFLKPSSGQAVVVNAGDSILGVALTAGTNATLQKAVDITPGLVVVMDSSSASLDKTKIGAVADITGGTGAMSIDYTTFGSGTTLALRDFNPVGLGAQNSTYTKKGAYVVIKRTYGI